MARKLTDEEKKAEKIKINGFVKEKEYIIKLEELVEAGKKAFDLLIKEVERPIDEELQDDRARNAMKAKKECFMDAKEIMVEVRSIEKKLNGEEELESVIEENEKSSAYEGGFAEKFAKNKK